MGARSPARVRVGRATRRSDKFHEVGRADHGNRGGDRDGHGGCWRIDRAGGRADRGRARRGLRRVAAGGRSRVGRRGQSTLVS
jgi:hypothetical protein